MSDSPIQVDGVPRPLPVEGGGAGGEEPGEPGAVLLAGARRLDALGRAPRRAPGCSARDHPRSQVTNRLPNMIGSLSRACCPTVVWTSLTHGQPTALVHERPFPVHG